MCTAENKRPIFCNVQDGETFKVGDMEFIKFPSVGGQTPVVMKDIAFRSRFGDNNDLRSSDVLRKMETEILPEIIDAVGKDNLCTIKTDLTTLDGLKPYGTMESLISLPTLDFYRSNVGIFDQHKPGGWWWLATPETARPHDAPDYVLCVSPSGCVSCIDCDGCVSNCIGVRPFCIFESSIFESSEE